MSSGSFNLTRESQSSKDSSTHDVRDGATADVMQQSDASRSLSAASTATTVVDQMSDRSKRKSSFSLHGLWSSSSSTRTRNRGHLTHLQAEERNNALLKRLASEKEAGVISPHEAQKRVSQLRCDIQAAGEAAPKRAHTGLFGTTCSTDLLFLVDTTGSMAGYIEAAKQQITDILDSIEATFLHEATIRMAVVSYKDHGNLGHNQRLDFTTSGEAVRAFLSQLTASGGGDTPEDVFGGINTAIACSWRQPNRCMIHISDAPPHGRKYHIRRMDDAYPNPGSEPHGLTHESLIKTMIKLNINYALLRIIKDTDMMAFAFSKMYAAAGGNCKLSSENRYKLLVFDEMAEARERGRLHLGRTNVKGGLLFEELKLGVEYDKLKHLVVRMVASSASQTATRLSGSSSQISTKKPAWKLQSFLGSIQEDDASVVEQAVRLEAIAPRWGRPGWLNETLVMEGFCPDISVHNANTLNEMMNNDDNIMLSTMELVIKKRSKPFAQGALRTASYAQTAASSNHSVVKAFKKCGKNLAHLAEDMRCQALCKTFALEFNALLDDDCSSLDFIVTTCLKGRAGDECLSLEPFIEGNYVKYNNNCGYVNTDNVDSAFNISAQAFSHFTFERSTGQFLVCDLQGVGGLLTDPVLHTADPNRFVITDTNLNEEGFKFFFSTHQCNDICRRLMLKSTAAMLASGQFDFRYDWPRMVCTGCCSNKLCGKIVQVSKARRSDEYPGCQWCEGCWVQLKPTTKMCKSGDAKHEFVTSDFFHETQGRRAPRLCSEHERDPEASEEDWEVSTIASGLESHGIIEEANIKGEYKSPTTEDTTHVPPSASRMSTVSSTAAGCGSIWSRLKFARRGT